MVSKTLRGVMVEQPQGSRQEIFEGELIGNDHPGVFQTGEGIRSGKGGEVRDIVRQKGTPLLCSKGQLISIRGGKPASLLRGEDVVAPVGEDTRQQRVHILVKVETKGCHSSVAIL